jgi:hypothetical protein
MPANNSRYLFAGFFCITAVYLAYNVFFVDAADYEQFPRALKHLSRLISIIIVYVIGFYSFKKYDVKWIRDLWNMMYLITGPLLLLIGLYDLKFGPAPEQFKSVAKTLHDFLISPVIYAAILIVKKTLGK